MTEVGDDFLVLVPHTVGALRAGLMLVLESLGVSWDNHARLASELGISKNLAWKVTRVLHDPDPMSVLTQIPGAEAFGTLMRKANSKGIDPSAIERLAEALGQLDRLQSEHAGDRASLELLAAGCASDQASSVAINHRKAAFTGNSFIWGVQIAAMHRIGIVRESLSRAGMLDIAGISVSHDLRKTRPVGSWLIGRQRVTREHPELASPALRGSSPEPLDPSLSLGEIPLIRPFCSSPLPPISSLVAPDGVIETRLEPGSVGDAGAVTIARGTILRSGVSLHRTPSDQHIGIISRLTTPTELFVTDLFVQSGLFPGTQPFVSVVSDLGTPEFSGVEDHPDLPIPVRVRLMGRGTACAASRQLPHAVGISDWAFQKLGWDPNQFDLYRAEILYPPIAASVQLATLLRPPK